VFLETRGRGGFIRAKHIVGADGANSLVRRIANFTLPREARLLMAYQIIAQGSFEPHTVEVYLTHFAKDFFAWVIPENSKTARIGIATNSNPKEAMKKFLIEKQLEIEQIKEFGGLIPIGPPLKSCVSGNAIIVGDAAFHTKSTSGGGIVTCATAARIAAKAIEENIRKAKSLSNYNKMLSPLYKELVLHWKIRKYLSSLSINKIDKLFEKAKKAKLDEFLSEYGDMDEPSRFLGKLMLKPSAWFLLPKLIKIIIG
ncbi:MAG: FAD-dependent monooxygenase, partial [Candidatus Diapherotrites archaeon]|nr:FAD-dependent monooxygenase [Candidatus Diapherotrites archaeon]